VVGKLAKIKSPYLLVGARFEQQVLGVTACLLGVVPYPREQVALVYRVARLRSQLLRVKVFGLPMGALRLFIPHLLRVAN